MRSNAYIFFYKDNDNDRKIFTMRLEWEIFDMGSVCIKIANIWAN